MMRKIVLSLLTIVFFILSVPLQKVDAAVTTVFRIEAEQGSFAEWAPVPNRPHITAPTVDAVISPEMYKVVMGHGENILISDDLMTTGTDIYYSEFPFEIYFINTGELSGSGRVIYKMGYTLTEPGQVLRYRGLNWGEDAVGLPNPSSYDITQSGLDPADFYEITYKPYRKQGYGVVQPSSEILVTMDSSNRLERIEVNWASYVKAKVYLNDVLIKTTDTYSPPVVAASTSISWFEIIPLTQIKQGENIVKVEFLKTDDTVTYDYKKFNSSAIEGGGGGGSGGEKGAPKIPQKPNSANVLDWIMYLVEWIIYPFEVVGWMFSKLFGAIGDVFNSSTGFIKTLSAFFSFLPAELISVLVVGLIVAVILRIFGR